MAADAARRSAMAGLVGVGGSSAAALGERRGCGCSRDKWLIPLRCLAWVSRGFGVWCAERAPAPRPVGPLRPAAWATGVGSLMVGRRFFFLFVDKMVASQFITRRPMSAARVRGSPAETWRCLPVWW